MDDPLSLETLFPENKSEKATSTSDDDGPMVVELKICERIVTFELGFNYLIHFTLEYARSIGQETYRFEAFELSNPRNLAKVCAHYANGNVQAFYGIVFVTPKHVLLLSSNMSQDILVNFKECPHLHNIKNGEKITLGFYNGYFTIKKQNLDFMTSLSCGNNQKRNLTPPTPSKYENLTHKIVSLSSRDSCANSDLNIHEQLTQGLSNDPFDESDVHNAETQDPNILFSSPALPMSRFQNKNLKKRETNRFCTDSDDLNSVRNRSIDVGESQNLINFKYKMDDNPDLKRCLQKYNTEVDDANIYDVPSQKICFGNRNDKNIFKSTSILSKVPEQKKLIGNNDNLINSDIILYNNTQDMNFKKPFSTKINNSNISSESLFRKSLFKKSNVSTSMDVDDSFNFLSQMTTNMTDKPKMCLNKSTTHINVFSLPKKKDGQFDALNKCIAEQAIEPKNKKKADKSNDSKPKTYKNKKTQKKKIPVLENDNPFDALTQPIPETSVEPTTSNKNVSEKLDAPEVSNINNSQFEICTEKISEESNVKKQEKRNVFELSSTGASSKKVSIQCTNSKETAVFDDPFEVLTQKICEEPDEIQTLRNAQKNNLLDVQLSINNVENCNQIANSKTDCRLKVLNIVDPFDVLTQTSSKISNEPKTVNLNDPVQTSTLKLYSDTSETSPYDVPTQKICSEKSKHNGTSDNADLMKSPHQKVLSDKSINSDPFIVPTIDNSIKFKKSKDVTYNNKVEIAKNKMKQRIKESVSESEDDIPLTQLMDKMCNSDNSKPDTSMKESSDSTRPQDDLNLNSEKIKNSTSIGKQLLNQSKITDKLSDNCSLNLDKNLTKQSGYYKSTQDIVNELLTQNVAESKRSDVANINEKDNQLSTECVKPEINLEPAEKNVKDNVKNKQVKIEDTNFYNSTQDVMNDLLTQDHQQNSVIENDSNLNSTKNENELLVNCKSKGLENIETKTNIVSNGLEENKSLKPDVEACSSVVDFYGLEICSPIIKQVLPAKEIEIPQDFDSELSSEELLPPIAHFRKIPEKPKKNLLKPVKEQIFKTDTKDCKINKTSEIKSMLEIDSKPCKVALDKINISNFLVMKENSDTSKKLQKRSISLNANCNNILNNIDSADNKEKIEVNKNPLKEQLLSNKPTLASFEKLKKVNSIAANAYRDTMQFASISAKIDSNALKRRASEYHTKLNGNEYNSFLKRSISCGDNKKRKTNDGYSPVSDSDISDYDSVFDNPKISNESFLSPLNNIHENCNIPKFNSNRRNKQTPSKTYRPQRQSTSIKSTIYNVMFSGLNANDFIKYEKMVNNLGGRIVKEDGDILVLNKLSRTTKSLLCASRGIPLVSVTWIVNSYKSTKFLDPMAYIFKDEPYKFIKTPRNIFRNWTVFITPNLKIPPNTLEEIIRCNGGRCILQKSTSEVPYIASEDRVFSVTCDLDKISKKLPPPHINIDTFCAMVLKQELDFCVL